MAIQFESKNAIAKRTSDKTQEAKVRNGAGFGVGAVAGAHRPPAAEGAKAKAAKAKSPPPQGQPKKGRPLDSERGKTLKATKPWLAMEPPMSRRTWFRRKAKGELT